MLASCAEETKTEDGLPLNIEITGQVNGADNQSVYIEAISQDGTIDVVQTTTDSDGKFALKGNIPGMGIYQMRVGEEMDKVIPLTLAPNDKLNVKAEWRTFAQTPIYSGTEWAAPLTRYMTLFNSFIKRQASLSELQASGVSEQELMEKYISYRKELDDYSREFMVKNPSNPVNIILTSSISPNFGFKDWDPENLNLFKVVSEGLGKKYPESPISTNLSNQVFQIESAYNEYLKAEEQARNPTVAPEIAMKSPEGKIITLSSLKGKYVLIDFWASWCAPCRKENPNVVRLYKKYKNKGFTVLSVSLDKDKTAWTNAILNDNLLWPYHVSDLLAWETPMTAIYGFQSIPHTVLVDKEGMIIARNLRGQSLEQKLEELL